MRPSIALRSDAAADDTPSPRGNRLWLQIRADDLYRIILLEQDVGLAAGCKWGWSWFAAWRRCGYRARTLAAGTAGLARAHKSDGLSHGCEEQQP